MPRQPSSTTTSPPGSSFARSSARFAAATIVSTFSPLRLDRHHGSRLPKEPLTRALNYLHNHWEALFRFLSDGRIPIDNNPAERALKAIALGRKVYHFAGSLKAAERAALFYTFVHTCKQHNVDAEAWLADVLPRVRNTRPSQYAALLPTRWQADREAERSVVARSGRAPGVQEAPQLPAATAPAHEAAA